MPRGLATGRLDAPRPREGVRLGELRAWSDGLVDVAEPDLSAFAVLFGGPPCAPSATALAVSAAACCGLSVFVEVVTLPPLVEGRFGGMV